MGDLGVEALLETLLLKSLSELNLKENNLTDRAVLALANSPHLTNLKSLN